jgi:catechol 2,3-dioxygenase-like lactoylglutathione lyase family enzyme
MSVQLNHTIVWCRDKEKSSRFLAGILGRPEPTTFMHFKVVELDNGASLDCMQKEGEVSRQHYAFLVPDEEFDPIFARIEANATYWADPARTRPGEINHHFGGHGVYFEDPDGHLLEVITRPYGSD